MRITRLIKRILKKMLPDNSGDVIADQKHVLSKIDAFVQNKNQQPIKVEIGAGVKKGSNGWLTLDMNQQCDIRWDLRNGLPFPDDTVSIIYSSHLFEHLMFDEINKLLKESYRALKPGGIFSICVPNARLFIDSYVNNDYKMFKEHGYYEPGFNKTTKIDMINYVAYMAGEHKYMFDEENLLYLLKQNGFRNPHLRDCNPVIDMPGRKFESIFAAANK